MEVEHFAGVGIIIEKIIEYLIKLIILLFLTKFLTKIILKNFWNFDHSKNPRGLEIFVVSSYNGVNFICNLYNFEGDRYLFYTINDNHDLTNPDNYFAVYIKFDDLSSIDNYKIFRESTRAYICNKICNGPTSLNKIKLNRKSELSLIAQIYPYYLINKNQKIIEK